MESSNQFRSGVDRPTPVGAQLYGSRSSRWSGILPIAIALIMVLSSLLILPGGPPSTASVASSSTNPTLAGGISPGGGTVCGAPSRIASALDILQPNPNESLPAGAILGAAYQYRAANFTPADAQITVLVPVAYATFPVSGGSDVSVTLPASSSAISGPGWSANTAATVAIPSPLTFTSTPRAGLTTEGYYTTSRISAAVQATTAYGNLTLEFRWQWQLTEPNGTTYTGAWTVPSTNSSAPELPSIFFPAPFVGSIGNTSSVAMGSNFTDTVTGYVGATSFTLSFQNATGTVEASQQLSTAATLSPQVGLSIPIVTLAHELAGGPYKFHLVDRCGALVQDLWFNVVYPATAAVAVAVAPAPCGPISIDGIPQANGSVVPLAASDVPRSLVAPACGRYAFEEWNSTGGVLAATPSSNHTVLLVSWNGTVSALYGIPNAIIFDETGLAANGTWSVTLGQITNSAGAGSPISFTAAAGLYSYSVGSNVPGLATPAQGQVTFQSTAISIDVVFSAVQIQHTVVIMLENQDLGTILQYAPYLNYLWNTYGQATNFYPFCHPSLPNYYVIMSGRYDPCGLDNNQRLPPSNATNLPDVLQAAGQSWAGYFESMPQPCDPNWLGTIYDPTHNPFLVSTDISRNASRCDAHVINSAGFNASVANGTLPNFSFYVPNTLDDCEYTGLTACNGWLQSFLPPILNSTVPAVKNLVLHTAFFILFDEGGTNLGYSVGGIQNSYCSNLTGLALTTCGGHTYMVVVSPYSHRDSYTANATGVNVETTIEWLLGVGNDGGYDASPSFPPMKSLFEPSMPAQYPVTVTETGLPAQTEWWVNLTNGQSFASTASSIVLSEPDGLYGYSISSARFGLPTPSGAFMVRGSPVTVPANFSWEGYLIAISETGLPPGAAWWLNLTGGRSIRAIGPKLSFHETNGSYPYRLGTNAPGYAAPPDFLFVDGANLSVDLGFSTRAPRITFQESGLPTGSGWWVVLPMGTSPISTTTSLRLNEMPGRYAYRIGSSDPSYAAPGGILSVAGGPVTVPVPFGRVTYTVTITEQGLPAGAAWWINDSRGGTHAGTGPTVSWAAPDGTTTYSTATADKRMAAPAGAITVDGRSVRALASFSAVRYAVTFEEIGLPPATLWTIALGGAAQVSNSSTISFAETNDSYAFTEEGVASYSAAPSTGSVPVAGENVTVPVHFSPVRAAGGIGWSVPAPSTGDFALAGLGAGVLLLLVVVVAVRRRRT
ncbi:MAG: alkaline phosphatase family protein [Thermoplasmata archaeon]